MLHYLTSLSFSSILISEPELAENPDFDWQMFYGAYVRSYIERDVRELSEIGDAVKFTRFMTVAAAQTGQLVNLTSMARKDRINCKPYNI